MKNTEVRSQKSEFRSQNSDYRSQKSHVGFCLRTAICQLGTAAYLVYVKPTAFRKGLKPGKLLVEIHDHALKDVAIAQTFTARG